MRIYIDFDDVLCETARSLCRLADRLYGRRVKYEEVFAFDLQISFNLSSDEIAHLMETAHSYELLMSYPESEGACETLSKWIRGGHELEIVTGRPICTHEGSLEWLAQRGIVDVPVIHVDKFGREPPPSSPDAPRSLSIDEFCQRKYDFAVEDSPMAFQHLARLKNCSVAVYERPWNKRVQMPTHAFTRCADWKQIDALLERYLREAHVNKVW